MRQAWKSFRTRLIAGAVVWIFGGVAVSGVALSELYRDHVTAQFDDELHGHAEELAALVDVDARGVPFLHRRLSDPRFLPRLSGYYWQIESAGGGVARSPSLDKLVLSLNPAPSPGAELHSFIQGPTGELRLVERTVRLAGRDQLLHIAIGTDERLLKDVLSDFNRTLYLSLSVLAAGLVAAAGLQVWFGLRPLASLRSALADVRQGRAALLSDDSPEEIRPLVEDMNALITANHEMIRRARAQAGNLAHGLKTPLAILIDEGERLRAAGHAEAADTVLAQCDRMRRQIDYQIARARAAASRGSPGAAADLEAQVLPLLEAMKRLHARREIEFEFEGLPGARVAVEAQDLNEMLGNLLDNAGKWAASQVRMRVRKGGSDFVTILIEDDGPGLTPESWEVVFDVGRRLDERVPGSGLGLPIVKDLATLYGGRAWLEASELGGLAAVLELPSVRS